MAATRNHIMVFLRLNRFSLKMVLLILERQLVASTAHLLFIAVFTNINMVKPAEPIFLYSTILIRALLFSQLNREYLISG